MRFGKTLQNSIYEPWKDRYVDYAKLKQLLKEDNQSESDVWTDEDEGRFVEELVNVQLENVNAFQVETYQQLRDRTSKCEAKLDPLAKAFNGEAEQSTGPSEEEQQKILQETLDELENITKETNELEKYSRINFTAFLKAAKKHDRKRGKHYRVRPLLQVRLAALPFNSEDYSPLLYRLSAMYAFVRQHSQAEQQQKDKRKSMGEFMKEHKYTVHKFWVHPDNLLEVKTYILRRLPVLVYNPQTSKVAEGTQTDPTITSLYFDNPNFQLYTQKVLHEPDAASLRLRWYGQLADKPEIVIEKKTITETEDSEEQRFPIKEKYIEPFVRGEYKMEKSIQKLQDRQGPGSNSADQFEKNVDDIQKFIHESELQPVLRANYTRTAFQVPGDNSVRISLDTNLALIREDALDTDRPVRDPDQWHRTDIDDAEMVWPFEGIRKGEISRFPHALLEIKIREGSKEKKTEWLTDLMTSHLVKEAPRFSKFVHGVATLFEDHVNNFPFWLSELETDIRRDPETAFEEEQEKKAKRAEDEFAVGSFLGPKGSSPLHKPGKDSPVRKAQFPTKTPSTAVTQAETRTTEVQTTTDDTVEEEDSDDDERPDQNGNGNARLRSLFPGWAPTKYTRRQSVKLPPGVKHPGTFIKDMGPVKVEPKVWLANQRTFIKWQHVTVLLATLSLGLYNAAGPENNIAQILAVVYTLIAVFTGAWGWWIYMVRSRLIMERSGKDFDNIFGPVVVCGSLAVALCLNFGFKYRAAMASQDDLAGNSSMEATPTLGAQTLKLIQQGRS